MSTSTPQAQPAAPEAMEANRRLLAKRQQLQQEQAAAQESPGPLQESCQRLLESAAQAKKFREQWEAWAQGKLTPVACAQHPDTYRPADPRASVNASREQGKMVVVHAPCVRCATVLDNPQSWIIRAGVPMELADATLDNWNPRTELDRSALQWVRKFAQRRLGTLVLMGGWGLGKTHLAVGVMQHLHCGWFVTQADLLTKIRAHHYNGAGGPDPEEKAKTCKLLVLDEVGLSTGGRDELPFLHGILNARHGGFLPTVLTGNISEEEMVQVVGGRVADRLGQSLFRSITLTGQSVRKELRASYGKPRS